MQISVIIPTCNRNNLLSKCLDLLAPGVQTIGPEYYEVVITDDSQDNNAKSLIETNYKWARWVEGVKRGPAANRNNGAGHAKCDWIVFIDDDCLPEKNILKEYSNGIEQHPNSLAFEGAIFPDDWEMLKKDMAECPVNMSGGCFWTANVCIQKNLFKDVGGFDEIFFLAAQEDQDLFKKLKKFTVVVFLEKCLMVHPVRIASLKKKLYMVPSSVKNWYFFARKEQPFLKCVSGGIKSQIKAFVKNFKKGRIKSMTYHLYLMVLFFPLMLKLKIMDNE